MQKQLFKLISLTTLLLTVWPTAHSQNVGIGTTSPKARLHVADSSVLFTGFFSEGEYGNPPIEGNGSRMMWYADKSAFRSGYVTGANWDKDSIGPYSVATGFNAKAKGTLAFAAGDEASAGGYAATAFGFGCNASGNAAVAMGGGNLAEGGYSMALGTQCAATAFGSVALGTKNNSSGIQSMAIGSNCTAGSDYSTALGFGAEARAAYSVGIGTGIFTSAFREVAVGSFNIPNIFSGSTDSWDPTDAIFTVGNGKDVNSRSNALSILKNGNVGIGSSTPHAQLQFSNAAVNRKIVLYEQADNDHQFYGLGVNGYVLRYQINDVASSHIFYAAASATTSNELMRIQGNGRVGIGTTAPDQLLTVNGNASKPGGGSWATFSDGRLKKNVTDYTAGLNEILAIHPVSFQYNELSGYTDTDARYVGVIAQEIEKVLPATISVVEGDDKVKDKRQFDGSELTYTLVNAIKQQQVQIEKLRAENAATNKQNELLQQRLDAIEKALGNK